MMRMMRAGPALLLVVPMVLGIGGAERPLEAQSILSAGGLGLPMTPIDARGRALGGVSVGLSGPSLSPTDPAAAADLRVPAVTLSLQSTWLDVGAGSDASDGQGTRFPLIGVAYPVSDLGMATLSFGGFLDQRWDVQLERLVDLGGEQARVTDTFVSDGGVSALRLGFARRISPSLAVGVSAGRYLGDLSRVFTRSFDSLAVEENVPPFQTGGRWSFSGTTVTGGAQVDLGNVVRVGGSLTWSGTLEAEPDEQTAGAADSFEIPLEYRLGATGVLAPGLTLVAGLTWADWSDAAEGELTGGDATSMLGLGVGLEFSEARILGRVMPLRVGYHRADLPFRFAAEDATESAFTAGLGLNMVQSGDIPLARVDLAVERGERDAGAVAESFWRASLTLRVAGF